MYIKTPLLSLYLLAHHFIIYSSHVLFCSYFHIAMSFIDIIIIFSFDHQHLRDQQLFCWNCSITYIANFSNTAWHIRLCLCILWKALHLLSFVYWYYLQRSYTVLSKVLYLVQVLIVQCTIPFDWPDLTVLFSSTCLMSCLDIEWTFIKKTLPCYLHTIKLGSLASNTLFVFFLT